MTHHTHFILAALFVLGCSPSASQTRLEASSQDETSSKPADEAQSADEDRLVAPPEVATDESEVVEAQPEEPVSIEITQIATTLPAPLQRALNQAPQPQVSPSSTGAEASSSSAAPVAPTTPTATEAPSAPVKGTAIELVNRAVEAARQLLPSLSLPSLPATTSGAPAPSDSTPAAPAAPSAPAASAAPAIPVATAAPAAPVALVASAAAVAESTPAPRVRTTAEVIQVVEGQEGLRGWTLVPLGHFQRGDRDVMVVWPALNPSGQLVDATVVGICLEEGEDGELEECGRRWAITDQAQSRAALIAALGGSDYRVVLGRTGAPLDELGPQLSQRGSDFTQAVSRGDRGGARQAAMAFTRLLPLGQVAFDNDVAQLLYLAASYNGRLVHAGTVQSGDQATLTFHVQRSILRLRTVTVTAQPVSAGSDRWIATSYR